MDRRASPTATGLVPELHTVTDDEAVIFVGAEVRRHGGLSPDTDHHLDGLAVHTLPRPPGRLLATVATVNDVHFGEQECGRVEGHEVGPVLRSAPGAAPYPEVMNAAVAREIVAAGPTLVVAKGDLTATGTPEQYAAFEACYRPGLGERLVVTLGNHDHPASGPCATVEPLQVRRLDGVTVAVCDTSVAGHGGGRLDPAQLEALDDLLVGQGPPVLVFGHHPAHLGDTGDWAGEGTALDGVSTDALVSLARRRPRMAGWFAGHTHRNRVVHAPGAPGVVFAEVASTKDYPGSWAEYRVYEGGMLAVHHRAASPDALAWSEACRALVFGLYPRYALGRLEDRCYRFGVGG